VVGLPLHAFECIVRVDEGDEAEQQADQKGEAQYRDAETQENLAHRLGSQRTLRSPAGCEGA